MSDKSSNVPSNIVDSGTDAQSLRISRVSTNRDSFFTAIKPLVKSKQVLSDLVS